MKKYDVIVVGGGAAGILAAISAALEGVSVALLEKGEKLGRKILITGGGRCNLSNDGDLEQYMKNIPGNGQFMYSAFSMFFRPDLIKLLENLGIQTKVEEKDKIYPVSNRAQTVVEVLGDYLNKLGVNLYLHSSVNKLLLQNGSCQGIQLESGEQFLASSIIIATGGASFPQTGSTGDGYLMAKSAGHSLVDLFPSAVALNCQDSYIINKSLQGLSLQDVSLTLYDAKGKKLAKEQGDIIFTHFGLSGPGALRVSRYVALTQKKLGAVSLIGRIDLWPKKDLETILKELSQFFQNNSRKSLKNVLQEYLPNRLALVCLNLLDLSEDMQVSQVSKEKINSIANFIKAIPVTITGTRALKEATITGGGIKVKEIDPKTFASKLIQNLYFAGEILDVDAHTGGYNLQCAFSMGYAAGKGAAQNALKEN